MTDKRPLKTEVVDPTLDDLNRMLRDASFVQQEPNTPLPVELRKIMAMPQIGGNFRLAANIVKHREKAVMVSNDTVQLWLPRSQVVKTASNGQVIVKPWIIIHKARCFQLMPNMSPEYLAWRKAKDEEERIRKTYPYSTGHGFYYKFDGKV